MKAIIQCYTPEEIERIARGEQTVKVCKTAPKDTPFKVYMYKKPYAGRIKILDKVLNDVYGGGKVVGEYVCDKIEKIDLQAQCTATLSERWTFNRIAKQACLTAEQLNEYLSGNNGYGWHITAPKSFDDPRELSEFGAYKTEWVAWYGSDDLVFYPLTRPPQSWCYIEEV